MARRRERPATDHPLVRWHRLSGRLAARAVVCVLLVSVATATIPGGAAVAQDGQWWRNAWRMPDVWQIADGAGVTVAVIDTGVDASIPELSDALIPGTHFVEGGDGTVDYDEGGHGTSMASLVAARPGGSSGVVGVAPSATLISIGVEGSSRRVVEDWPAIVYAVDHGADVINISRAGIAVNDCHEKEAAAIRYALSQDVVVVAGSGNTPGGPDEAPGACPGVLTVGALDPDLAPAEYSHRSQHVEVAAPGSEIASILPGGGVDVADGTSNSTALVSGVVALVRAEFPDATAYEVVARVLATVQDVGESGQDDATGYGMVRPYEALTADVPADAPNPVFDTAGDLTNVEAPSPDPTAFDAGDAPDFAAPPSADDDGPAVKPIIAIAAVGALFVIVAAVVIAIVVARARRRQQPHAYPAAPPPPYRPGPPGPPR